MEFAQTRIADEEEVELRLRVHIEEGVSRVRPMIELPLDSAGAVDGGCRS
jgi:hypothetical protein